jgi:hypothetical protein
MLSSAVKSVSAGLVFPCGTECREDPVGKLKRKDVTVIGGLSKIDHARLRKGQCPDDGPPKLNGGKDASFKCDDRISCILNFASGANVLTCEGWNNRCAGG